MKIKLLLALSLACTSITSEAADSTAAVTTPNQTAPVATTTPEIKSTTPATTEAASNSESLTELTKDQWLSSMDPVLPSVICKGFLEDAELKKRFEDIKMTEQKCISVIPESATKCRTQLYPSIPQKINDAEASTWGKKLGECIGKDFAIKYLIPN